MVACVQTFGNFANFHPHLHILVTDGGFGSNGTFSVLPEVSLSGLEQLFRHRVLKMMLRALLITPRRVKPLLSWNQSGFNVDGSGICKTKMVKGPNRNFQVYDPLDFLAAVTAHIPDRREHLVRYCGWYCSVQRGKRRKPGLEAKTPEAPPIEDDTAEARATRRAWARLTKKIYEVGPLICPECSIPMRIISISEEEDVIRKILEHLKPWEESELWSSRLFLGNRPSECAE